MYAIESTSLIAVQTTAMSGDTLAEVNSKYSGSRYKKTNTATLVP